MAEERSRDEVTEWALGELGRIEDGISINELFRRLGNAYNLEDSAKNAIWKTLLSRDDVLLGDNQEKQQLKKSSLDTVPTLRSGDRIIRLQRKALDENLPSPTGEEDTIQVDAPAGSLDSAPSTGKRRGRPPKRKAPIRKTRAPSNASSAVNTTHDLPVSSTELTTNEVPNDAIKAPISRRSTRSSKTQDAASADFKVNGTVDSTTTAVRDGFQTRSSRSKAATNNKSPIANNASSASRLVAGEKNVEEPSSRRSTRTKGSAPLSYSVHRGKKRSIQSASTEPGTSGNGMLGGGEAQFAQKSALQNQTSDRNGNLQPETAGHVAAILVGEQQTQDSLLNETALPNRVSQDHQPIPVDEFEPNTIVPPPSSSIGHNTLNATSTQSITLPLEADNLSSKERVGESQSTPDASASAAIPEQERQDGEILSQTAPSSPAQSREPPKLDDSREDTPRKRGGHRKSRTRDSISVADDDEEHQAGRVAGLPCVYKDLFESEKGRDNAAIAAAESLVLIFKSNKLRNVNWLVEHRGKGTEAIAATIAAAVIEKEDTTEKPSRRKKASKVHKLDENADTASELMTTPESKRRGRPRSSKTGQKEEAQRRDAPDDVTQSVVETPPARQTQAPIEDGYDSVGKDVDGASELREAPSTSLPQLQVSNKRTTAEANLSAVGPSEPVRKKRKYERKTAKDSDAGPTETIQGFQSQDVHWQEFRPGAPSVASASSRYSQPMRIQDETSNPTFPPSLPYDVSVSQSASSFYQNVSPRLYQSPYTSAIPQQLPPPQEPGLSLSSAINNFTVSQYNVPKSSELPSLNSMQPFPKMPHSITTPNKPKRRGPKSKLDKEQQQVIAVALANQVDPQDSFNPQSRQLSIPSSPSKPPLSQEKGSNSSQIPAPKSRGSKAKRAAAEKARIEAALTAADAVGVAEGPIRLAVIYQEIVGNLLLSVDKTILEFFGIDQRPPEIASLIIPISQMDTNPVTSVRGSYPMELRVICRESSDSKTYRFQFAATKEGYEAASIMRAKLVTARITSQVRNGRTYDGPQEAEYEILKPWKCDKCGSRFKNDVGLKYHLTKSQTSCNPDFDISQVKHRGPKPTLKNTTPRRPKRVPKEVVESSTEDENETDEEEDEEEDRKSVSGDSDDSIFDWAQTVATDGIRPTHYSEKHSQTPKSQSKSTQPRAKYPLTKTKGNYRRMRNEAEFLNEMATSLGHPMSNSRALIDKRAPRTPVPADDQRAFEDIILALVQQNEGLFPGDKSLWFGFVGSWLKDPMKYTDVPDSRFCFEILDGLVAVRKLKYVAFTFHVDGKKPRSRDTRVDRSVVVALDANVDPTKIDSLKKLIISSYPEDYIPSQFLPAEPWASRVRNLAAVQGNPQHRKLGEAEQEELSDELVSSDEEDEEEPIDLDFSEDTDYEGDQRLTTVGNEHGEGSLRRSRRRRTSRILSFPTLTPTRTSLTQEENERRTRNAFLRLHAWAPALPFLPDPETGAWNQLKKVTKRGKTLPPERKHRRDLPDLSRLATWGPAPMNLPDPRDGAWNLKPPEPAKPPRILRSRKLRTRIPEPITFLQDRNGAWSQRAFGHGVTPIFSRPARRADGNPTQKGYLKRLQTGFRPVLVPTKNRQFLPAVPSKFLLKNLDARSPTEASGSELHDSIEPDGTPPTRLRPRKKRSEDVGTPETPGRRYARRTAAREPESSRRRSKLSRVESMSESSEPEPEPENVRRSGRLTRKTRRTLDEVELLNFFEPKAVDAESLQNPGLGTLPLSFWPTESPRFSDGPADDGYAPQYDKLRFPNPKVASYTSDMADGSWILHNSYTSLRGSIKGRWLEDTAFTIETLPYNELKTDSEESEAKEPPKRKRQRRGSESTSDYEPVGDRFETARPLTSLREDFENVLDDPRKATSIFGVQISYPSVFSRSKKGQKAKAVTTTFELRLVVAVVAIRTLTGGLEALVDWVIISGLFPDYSTSFLTKHWRQLENNHSESIEKIVLDFQQAFLPAYQKGQVPSIDFDNLVEYDWEQLIDWVIESLNPTLDSADFKLPANREDLEASHDLQETDPDASGWREAYFGLQSAHNPMYKRMSIAASFPASIPLSVDKAQPLPVDDFTVAKSWVRATALTPEEDWDHASAVAREKLESLGNDLVKTALDSLIERKVLMHRSKGRALPGRSYEATDFFMTPLRKHIQETQFQQAFKFKMYLDSVFASGKKRERVSYMADDGAIMCITSLQAARRIRLEGVNVPMNKFGLSDNGNYQGKDIPKERFKWDIDIVPTASYALCRDISALDNLTMIDPPGVGASGELPVWLDIGASVISELWRKIITVVAQTVALRSGSTAATLAKVFTPTLEHWEIRRIMDWGCQVGIFERLHPQIEGWTVGEWWWVCVGRLCEQSAGNDLMDEGVGVPEDIGYGN